LVAVDTLPLEFTHLEVQQQKMIDEATLVLKSVAETLKGQNVNAQPVVVVGHTAEKIVDYAIAHAIDLIVMSTHGRTGIQRWLLGSVAGKVSTVAPCPVLLVRAG
jgi:nucleotide-binding universal stress UspA family protein